MYSLYNCRKYNQKSLLWFHERQHLLLRFSNGFVGEDARHTQSNSTIIILEFIKSIKFKSESTINEVGR